MKIGPKTFVALVIGGPLVLAFVLVVIIAPAAREAGNLRTVGDTEYAKTRLGSYSVYHPADDAASATKAAEVAVGFEAALRKRFGGTLALAELGGTVDIYLLRDHDHLVAFGMRSTHADLVNNGGYFDSSHGAIASIGDNWETLAHELTHALVHVSERRGSIPNWLNEGFAQYCETWAGQSGRLGDVEAAAARFDRLVRDREAPTLAELMQASGDAFRADDNARFYVTAHVLVAYMIDGEASALSAAFARMFNDGLAGARITARYVEDVTGRTLDELDSGMRAFARSARRGVSR